MFVDGSNLEAISELPRPRATLNQNQIRRLKAIDCWLREIRDSEEFTALDYCPDVTLGDAIQAVNELLQEHEPERQEQKLVIRIRRVIFWREKVRSFIQNAASEVAILSLLTTGCMIVGAIFCYGLDRTQQSKGSEYQPTWANNSKVFEGSAIASIAVFLGASLAGACISGDKEHE